jgi:hypothetical protein
MHSPPPRRKWWETRLLHALALLMLGTLALALQACIVTRVIPTPLERASWKSFAIGELGIVYEAPDQRLRPGVADDQETMQHYGCKVHSFWLNDAEIRSSVEQLDLVYISIERYSPTGWRRLAKGEVPTNAFKQEEHAVGRYYPQLIMHPAVVAPLAAKGIFLRRDYKCPNGDVVCVIAFYRDLEQDPARRRIHIATIKRILNSVRIQS